MTQMTQSSPSPPHDSGAAWAGFNLRHLCHPWPSYMEGRRSAPVRHEPMPKPGEPPFKTDPRTDRE